MQSIDDLKSELLTMHDVCDILKIKMRTLYSWIYKKKIPFVKLNRAIRFRRQDVEVYLKNLH